MSSTLSLAFADGDSEVEYFYAAMTMFAKPYTRWVAQAVNGTMLDGVFTYDGAFSLLADIRWAAVWADSAAASSHGTLFQFPVGRAPVGSAGFKNAFDNRKNDHKLYLRIDPPRGVGVPLTIQHTVLDFEATNATWVGIARSLVRGWPTQ